MSSALANESVTYNHLTVDLRKRLFNTDSGVTLLNEPDLTQQIMEIAICVVATDSDITLSGEQTIQSVNVYANNFVCVNGQTDKKQNGVYLCKDSNWERWADGKAGHFAKILKGTYANRIFHNINYELLYETTEIEFEIVPNKVSELFDVSLSSLITNDILKFDGTNWINTPIPAGAENLSELNDVTLSSLVTNDALVWDGTKWVNLEIDGLPSGTVEHSILRNNSSNEYVESTLHKAGVGSTNSYISVTSPSGTINSSIEASNTQNALWLNYDGGKYGYFIVNSTTSYIDLKQGSGRAMINAYATYNALNEILYIGFGATKYFTVKQDGKMFSNSLSTDSLLKSNSSKEIVSITNSSGYLKNDGSGGFSWDTPGGGGVDELSELIDVELTSLATDDFLQFDGSVWRNVELTTATLPTGTENQTLRYNSSNELEANSILEVTENGVIVDGTDGDEDTFTINHKGDSYYGLRIINSNEGTDVSSIQINDLLNGDILLINKNSNEWNVRFGDSYAAFPINFYIDRIKASTGETNIVTIDDTGLLGSSLLSSSDDIYTKVSSADTTSGYLNDKIDVVNITKDIINPGANEVLRLTGFDGDYNSLSNLPTIPENLDDLLDVTLSSLATNDYLMYNGTNWINEVFPAIPNNRHSFLALNDTFANENWELPDTEPSTVYETVGSSGFKVSLKANKRYKIDITLYFPDDDGSLVWNGQLKVVGGSGWSSQIFALLNSSNQLKHLTDIYTGTSNFAKVIPTGLGAEIGLFYENDSGAGYIETLQIRGHIDTVTDDVLTLEFRNVTRDGTDGLRNAVIRQGSYISAIESEIN